MAFPTRSAVFLDESPQIAMGKRADAPGAKPLKSSTRLQGLKALKDVSNISERKALKSSTRLQERKALKDVSNISERKALKDVSNISERKALKDVSNISELKALKDVSNISGWKAFKVLSNFSEQKPLQSIISTKVTAVKEKPTLKEKPARPKTIIFADEDAKKCHEWAKDGVEGAHFTGNESQKFDKDVQDKRVKKKVEKVISAVQGWADVSFVTAMFPAKDVGKVFEEVNGLDLEPEILPDINSHISNSCNKQKLTEDSFTDDELDQYPDKKPVEFLLRDEPANPGIGIN